MLMLLSERGEAREEALEMSIFPTRILLAIDASEEAELATRKAVDLADGFNSQPYVVHVGQLPNFLMGAPGIELYDEIEHESREVFRKLVWRVKLAGRTVAGAYLRMGAVDLEIVGLAKELGADLIVMGSRGHRGIRRAIEGSVSDAVIRRAPCPVLVVCSHQSAEAPEWDIHQQGSR
jgi:nucleotide-binding universal stress UspA family protein